MNMLVGLAGLAATAYGITISTQPESALPVYHVTRDHINVSFSLDSKPGTPKIAAWEGAPMLNKIEPWSVKLSERLFKAARAREAMKKCGRFLSFGDYTWCMKAMPREAFPEFRKAYGGLSEFVVNERIVAPDTNFEDFTGLSFGIRTSDGWSELMSSMFLVKTELFDCYFNGTQFPEGPMVYDMHDGYKLARPCMKRGCYTTTYKVHHVCNDDTTNNTERFRGPNNRTYEPLHHALAGRPKLSTFIKMDVEGSEWATVERLLENEEDMAKIRTLDMEVHFNLDATPKGSLKVTPETVTRHVEIMEKLARKFAVTGSSLETYAQRIFAKAEKTVEHYKHVAQPFVYTKDGLPIDQYTISFVNRKLL